MLNMFAYAGNNPVMNVDPSGLEALNLNWLNNNLRDLYFVMAMAIM